MLPFTHPRRPDPRPLSLPVSPRQGRGSAQQHNQQLTNNARPYGSNLKSRTTGDLRRWPRRSAPTQQGLLVRCCLLNKRHGMIARKTTVQETRGAS